MICLPQDAPTAVGTSGVHTRELVLSRHYKGTRTHSFGVGRESENITKPSRKVRQPNAQPRPATDFEVRVQVAERWIHKTIIEFFKGSLRARSEGDAIDTLDKKVRPGNTRLGRGLERRRVLVTAFRNLIKQSRLIWVEDRAIYEAMP